MIKIVVGSEVMFQVYYYHFSKVGSVPTHRATLSSPFLTFVFNYLANCVSCGKILLDVEAGLCFLHKFSSRHFPP
jgi:hypothetical protein